MNNLLPCVDWAEQLAQKPEDLSPTKRQALQAHLATCPACAQTSNDYHMLITRLRALPRPACPQQPQFVLEAFTAQASHKNTAARNGAVGERVPSADSGPIILLPPAARHAPAWQQRLSALIAAVVLLALVGTFALMFLNHGQSAPTLAQPQRVWKQIALYSGTGSKTITGQHLRLPQAWGTSFACFGSGAVNLTITSPYMKDQGSIDCQAAGTPSMTPQGIGFDLTPSSAEIQAVSVQANANTRWYLQYFVEIPQPSFSLGSGWIPGNAIGGTSGSALLNNGVLIHITGQIIRAATWGIVFVCTGNGAGTIQFIEDGSATSPGAGGIPAPACDGQPRLVAIHYPSLTAIRAVSIKMQGNMVWEAQQVVCFGNKSQCQSSPAPINVTPTPTTPPNAPPGA